MTIQHSTLSASAADRWTACPGSIAMSQNIPDLGNSAAQEGTALHELMNHCLVNDVDADGFERFEYMYNGQKDVIELTDEQRDVVQQCVNHVRATEGIKFYEMTVSYGETLGQDADEAFGTADIIIVNGTHVEIQDAKFGRTFVDKVENKQMLLYAIGVVQALEALGDEIKTVGMNILQPRVGGKVAGEPWVITRKELDDWGVEFKRAATAVQEATLTFVPPGHKDHPKWAYKHLKEGESQCRWCKAAAACVKLNALAQEVSRMSTDQPFDEVSVVSSMPEAVLSAAVSRLPLLEIYSKAVTAEAMRRLSDGLPLVGYKLIQGREGHRRWADEDKVKKALTELGATDAALYGPPKLKSPAQMVQVVRTLTDCNKAEAEESLAPLVVRNPAKPAMVRDEVPGDPWSGSASASEFEVL